MHCRLFVFDSSSVSEIGIFHLDQHGFQFLVQIKLGPLPIFLPFLDLLSVKARIGDSLDHIHFLLLIRPLVVEQGAFL